MDKLTAADPETRSPDLAADNVAQLKALFPSAFAGDALDFDALRQLLGAAAADESPEKYGLSWHGKGQARRIALAPSAATLRPCPQDSQHWDTTQNLFLEGDNLEILKLLQKSYAGQVKLIYIDPPYNTGKDRIYPDDYQDGIGNYLRLTGQTDDQGHKVSTNPESSGRFHTHWLNMIYPRLKVARNLLREDGILVVSISDGEVHNLRECADEIFGMDNLLGCVVWNSTKSVTNTALISVSHTYNVIYARDRDYFVRNRAHFRLPEDGKGFSNPDEDPRGPWKADPFQVGGERPNQMYPITNPKTGQIYRPNPGNSWKNELKVFEQLMTEGRIVFGASGEAGPQRKRFLNEVAERGRVAKTWWDDIDTTTNATAAVKNLMGESVFGNPKPVSLIQRFIQLGVHDPSDAIVLDFFAGSGTTGHAVMLQNAEDGGNRRYILVQLPELLDPADKDQRVAANFCDSIGKPRNLAEIAKERLRRAGRQIWDANPDFSGDTGFRAFRLDSSNIKTWDPHPADLEQALLDHVEPIKEGRSEQDILYELLLKFGYDLCAPLEQREIAGKIVYATPDGSLRVCLARSLDLAEAVALAGGLAAWQPELPIPPAAVTAIFRDSAFADDVVKVNLTEILRQRGIARVRSI